MIQTIVIGHKNPDMDSICAAAGYARLKQLMGVPNVTAARAGNTNERIDFVLKKFGVETPALMADVSPRVCDVMERNVIAAPSDMPVYEAVQLIEKKRLRGLPVVDAQRHCLGLLSTFKITHHLFPPREEAVQARVLHASLTEITRMFDGEFLTPVPTTDAGEHLTVIGAMNHEAFIQKIERYRSQNAVLFVGNREHIQEAAIAQKFCAVVITGGLTVTPEIRRAAREAGVTLISSPHDTATSVLLARGAMRVERMLDGEFMSFSPETRLDRAREETAESDSFVFPVLENNRLVGMFSKSDFLKPIPRQLILVDHNELSQAVEGAEKIPVVEILDHHRLGGFSSETPVLFWNNPVGSTSTIVTLCYRQAGIKIPKEIAGLLMAGLISDTLNLSSPTATPTDSDVLDELSRIAEVKPADLAEQIFSVGSPLLTLEPQDAITADCKEYSEKGKRFSVSQIEELSFSHFPQKREALIEALERHARTNGYLFSTLLVTDINTQNSLLLACGAEEFLRQIAFPSRGANIWDLDGIVSRKKQLLPYLLRCLETAQRV